MPRFVWPGQRWALVWLRVSLIGPVPLMLLLIAMFLIDTGRTVLASPPWEILTGIAALYGLGVAFASFLAAIWLAAVMVMARRHGEVRLWPGVVLGCLIASLPLTILFAVLWINDAGPDPVPEWRFALAWTTAMASGGIAALGGLWPEMRRHGSGIRPEEFD